MFGLSEGDHEDSGKGTPSVSETRLCGMAAQESFRHAETERLTEMLASILNQLGADGLTSLRRPAEVLPKQSVDGKAPLAPGGGRGGGGGSSRSGGEF